MDEDHLLNAIRYVTLNPVRAGLVERASDWKWSSARAHLSGEDSPLVKVAPVLERTGDFAAFLGETFDEAETYSALRRAETTGRPIGAAGWLKALEEKTGRALAPGKPGRKSQSGIV